MISKPGPRTAMRLEIPYSDVDLRSILPFPADDAHKYSRGTLSVVAGSARYPGAAVLACRAGQRMGAGYTQLYAPKAVRDLALASQPSLVARPRREIDLDSLGEMKHPDRHAFCVGSGFVAGDSRTDALVLELLAHAPCPVLVDGGALAALGSKKALKTLSKRSGLGLVTVITPHAGEAQRLAAYACLPSDDPGKLSAALAMALGATVVLKGPDTFISQGMRVYPMLEGTAALAKAGTGDVLAGMIASLLAQGLGAMDAAVLGTTMHARAGLVAADVKTSICVTPEDVIDAIPDVVRSFLGTARA